MSQVSSLYRSEYFRTYVKYVAVGLTFIPFGTAYGVMVAVRGGPSVFAFVVMLGLGLIATHFTWARVESYFARAGVRVAVNQSTSHVIVFAPQTSGVRGLGFVVAVVTVVGLTPPTGAMIGQERTNSAPNTRLVCRDE